MGIVVPITQPTPTQSRATPTPPPAVFLAMATAQTHALGRLLEPESKSDAPANRS